MLKMIEDRKGSAILEERRDLMSNLIRASIDEKSLSQKDFDFTPRDLLGNIFVFLLAGELFASGTPDGSIELWPRSRNYSECFIIYHRSSGNPSRGAGRAL